jgi:ABC-type Mn2+/Zn2+ transport system ATPase subunit
MDPTPDSTFVSVHHAMFGYGARAVVGVDALELCAGRCLGIFGPNGAGKTTLIRGMTGLLPPMTVARSSDSHGATVKPHVQKQQIRFGYLPQYRGLELHWPMTGFDAAAMAISARRPFGWVGRDRALIRNAMKLLNVEDLATRHFARLSGGQQQRLLLAGAMASEPHVLVLDEPTDGLDVHSRQRLLALLRDLAAKGLCIVIISHEVEDLLFLCHEIAWLHPADEPGEPSHVERIVPDAFAQRVLGSRAATGT